MIIGVESCCAMCSPLMALAAPGPRVTKQMPGSPVILPQASAMMAAPPSCRQITVRMRLESCRPSSAGKETLARHREGRARALRLELVDQDLAAVTHIAPRLPVVVLAAYS